MNIEQELILNNPRLVGELKELVEHFLRAHKNPDLSDPVVASKLRLVINEFFSQAITNYKSYIAYTLPELADELKESMITDWENSIEERKKFKKEFNQVWRACIFDSDTENLVAGYGFNNTFYLNGNKIKENKDRIIGLLSKLKTPILKYEDLMYLKSGAKWTDFRLHVDMLIALGNSILDLNYQENLEQEQQSR